MLPNVANKGLRIERLGGLNSRADWGGGGVRLAVVGGWFEVGILNP